MKQKQPDLSSEKIGNLMRRYTVPCIISLLVGALYNIVDQIFIANASCLGSYGNAANTVVFPLTVIALGTDDSRTADKPLHKVRKTGGCPLRTAAGFLRPSTETGRIILLYTPFAMRRYAAKALSFHGLLSGFYALLQSGLFPFRVNYS